MTYIPPKGNELVFNMEKFVEPILPDQSYKNLKGVICSSPAEIFCHIRDFICKRNGLYDYSLTGIGYELIDYFYDITENSPSLDDWYVIKSINENGLSLYFKIVYQNSQYISVIGYRYWDTDLHDGIDAFYNIAAHIPLSDSSVLWIYGDTTSIAILNIISDIPYLFLFGTTQKSLYSQKSISSLEPLSSGLNVNIKLKTNIDSYVDDKVFIFDNDNIELTTILSINTINKEIKANLSNSYPEGALVTSDLCVFVQATNDLTSIDNFKGLIGNDGLKNVALNWDIFDVLLDKHDPSLLNSDYMTSEIGLSGSGFQGYLRNMQISGFGTNLPDGSLFNDHHDNWRLFTVNGYKLLFREV